MGAADNCPIKESGATVGAERGEEEDDNDGTSTAEFGFVCWWIVKLLKSNIPSGGDEGEGVEDDVFDGADREPVLGNVVFIDMPSNRPPPLPPTWFEGICRIEAIWVEVEGLEEVVAGKEKVVETEVGVEDLETHGEEPCRRAMSFCGLGC